MFTFVLDGRRQHHRVIGNERLHSSSQTEAWRLVGSRDRAQLGQALNSHFFEECQDIAIADRSARTLATDYKLTRLILTRLLSLAARAAKGYVV